MTTETMLLRIFLAVVVGGLVGWERESERKPAGIRTHMLVSLGAAVFALMTADLMQPGGLPSNDASSRVVAAIVTGVGFLGGGTIIQSRGQVEGLTTAAALWLAAALGAAVGLGHYLMAVVAAALALFILRVLGAATWRFGHRGKDGSQGSPEEQ